jgi:hypothetical protein
MLDNMIQEDPEKRGYSQAGQAREVASHIARLFEANYRVVSSTLPSRCMYCGQGDYRLIAMQSPNEVNNFGLTARSGSSWRAMVCEHCGHVQLFRPDLTKSRGAAWER